MAETPKNGVGMVVFLTEVDLSIFRRNNAMAHCRMLGLVRKWYFDPKII